MSSLGPVDLYFESFEEPVAGCMQALRSLLRSFKPALQEAWKYRMLFIVTRTGCSVIYGPVKKADSPTSVL